MDTTDLLNNDLQVSPAAQAYLAETAKWGKFLAILGFIMCGIMVIVAILLPSVLVNVPPYNQLSEGSLGAEKAGITVVYLIFAVLFFFPCFYLYKFSVKTQAAFRSMNQEALEDGLANLKSTFKFYGIMAIVILSIYALIIIIAVIAAAMR